MIPVGDVFVAANVALAAVYLALAGVAAAEMIQGRTRRGLTRFGVGFTAVMGTSGLVRLAAAQSAPSQPVLVAVAMGFGPASLFLWLRLERHLGGRGERFIAGTPPVVALVPLVVAFIAGANYAVAGFDWPIRRNVVPVRFVADVVLVATHLAIAWVYARTQTLRRTTVGGWSLTGLAVAVIFPTHATVHGVHGLIDADAEHLTLVTVLAVPAALWFLWSLLQVHRDAVADWHRHTRLGVRRRPSRRPPWRSTAR